jgi:PHD/YefM family antitoxin component YafN of YafNO toxin-antitoxin module
VRTTITDHGVSSAMVIGAEELADLEEQIALLRVDLREAQRRSATPVSQSDALAFIESEKGRLGLRRG